MDRIKKVILSPRKGFCEKLLKIIEQYNRCHDEEDVFKVLEDLIKLKDAIYLAIEEGHDMNLTKSIHDAMEETGDDGTEVIAHKQRCVPILNAC